MPIKKKEDTSKGAVISEALRVRGEHHSRGASARDLLKSILKKHRGKIEYLDHEEFNETLTVEPDGSFTVYLPWGSSVLRDNFTIAHELGHYFVHLVNKNDGDSVSFARRGSNRKEWEANWFAAELLMPAGEFLAAAKACSNDVEELASLFGVSGAAAKVRLTALKNS